MRYLDRGSPKREVANLYYVFIRTVRECHSVGNIKHATQCLNCVNLYSFVVVEVLEAKNVTQNPWIVKNNVRLRLDIS